VKVCLSFSAHHPELWQPAWGIRLILEALISFLPTPADGAIGALDWTSEERKRLAKESVKYRCPACCAEGETCADLLPKLQTASEGDVAKKKTKFQEEIEKLKMLQFQNHAIEEKETEEAGKKEDISESTSEKGHAEVKKSTKTVGDSSAASKPPPAQVQEQERKDKKSDTKQGDEKENQSLNGCANDKPNVTSLDAPRRRSTGDNTTICPNNAPSPPPIPENAAPPIPENVAQQATESSANTAPTPADDAGVDVADGNNNNNAIPLVSDGLLNGMIGMFAVIVLLLLRESHSLIDELYGLGNDDE